MAAVQQQIEKVGSANVPVLIQGESGTGKEIIAKLIHESSEWKNGPFITINCPAVPGTLIESELFGYEKGAFTGAYSTKPGRVEMAKCGSLFLDEIGEMDMGLQAKLLQLLQDGQFCRIGSQEDKRMTARVICATNRDLEEEVAVGTFRQDLYYRINVVNIFLPPLRERSEDVPELVSYFLNFYSDAFNRPAPPLSAKLITALQQYNWPGNVRQLENLIKRYVVLGSESVILSGLEERESDMFNFAIPPDGNISLKQVTRQAVKQVERKVILKVIEANNWNRKRAAKLLNISYRALLYKLKEVNLPPEHGRQYKSKRSDSELIEAHTSNDRQEF